MNGRQCAKFCCIILAISSVIFLGLTLHCREPTIGKKNIFFVLNTRIKKENSYFVKVQHIPCLLYQQHLMMIFLMNL